MPLKLKYSAYIKMLLLSFIGFTCLVTASVKFLGFQEVASRDFVLLNAVQIVSF